MGDNLKVTNDWIEMVESWQRQDDLNDQVSYLPALTHYLKDLNAHFQHENVDDVTRSRVILLLSKLSDQKIFLADLTYSLYLIRCILLTVASLPVEKKQSNKTKALMQQLSKTLLSSVDNHQMNCEINELIAFTGFQQKDLYQSYFQNVCATTVYHLLNPPLDSTDLDEPAMMDSMNSVARICLCLRNRVEFDSLMEAILFRLLSSTTSSSVDSDLLFREITSIHRRSRIEASEDGIPYVCLVIIWRYRMKYLEEEILDLIEFVTAEKLLTSCEKLLTFSKHLIKACCQHSDVHCATFSILQNIYKRSLRHPVVSWIISTLSKEIWPGISPTKTESHLCCYAKKYQSLVRILATDPFLLSSSVVQVKISQLVKLIEYLSVESEALVVRDDVSWMLTEFNSWNHVIIFISLQSSDELVSTGHCIRLLSWYHGLYNLDGTRLSQLEEMVLNLKSLISKSSLTIDDVIFVISSCHLQLDKMSDESLRILTKKLLLAFYLQSSCLSSTEMLRQFFTLVLCVSDPFDHLIQLVSILRIVWKNNQSRWLQDVCIKTIEMKTYLRHLVNQVTSSSSSATPSNDWILEEARNIMAIRDGTEID